jgi:SDR family mycofactocin-dependent oxidoreductase
MDRLSGKVAFITGGARGQGRSHAVRMAEEGADIITLDLCQQIDTVSYPMATPEDLDETVRLVEKTGRRILAREADVRDFDAVESVLNEGVMSFGHVDYVVANAGIFPAFGAEGRGRLAFYDAVDIMLSGVFHTCEAAIPSMIERGDGGAIIIISSSAGLKALAATREAAVPGILGYTAAKHGVVGLMRSYANALGSHHIRCNTVHTSGVNSPMVVNEAFRRFVEDNPDGLADSANPLQVGLLDARDVSNVIVFLCSQEGQYITGVTLPVDAGLTSK